VHRVVIRSYPEGIGAKYVGRPDLAVEIARIRAKAAADGGPGEAAAGEADAHSPRGAHSGRDEDAGRTGNGQDEADSGQEQAGDSDPADDEPHQGHRHWCNFPRFPSIQFDDALGLMRTRPTYLVDGLIPRTGLMAFYDASKSYKSFLVVDLGMYVALGWPHGGARFIAVLFST
jgi:hypothetical protein